MRVGFHIERKPRSFQKKYRNAVTAIFVAATLLAIAFLVTLNASPVLRFLGAVAVLIVAGHMIAGTNSIQDSYGAYMLGSRRGIRLITDISQKHRGFWTALADWGLVLSFGVASYFIFRKSEISKRTVVLGAASIFLILLFVFPYLPLVLSFINIPQFGSGYGSAPISLQNPGSALTLLTTNPLFVGLLVISVLFGFGAAIVLLLLYGGGVIIYGISAFLLSVGAHNPNYVILNQQVPGVVPLIPGITIPLFAGIISLFILLVVHEFSHGILAKISGIRIKAIGVILLGIIPLGAYVEPDERAVKRLKKMSQDRISVAGISANMLVSILFFALTLIMIVAVFPSIDTGGVLVTHTFQNYSAYNVIMPNSIITKWNNNSIRNLYDLALAEKSYRNGSVAVTTNEGRYVLIPDSSGRIGISAIPAVSGVQLAAANFFYAIVALSFGLNFFVAIANLLPIPMFDGWRIYQNRIRSKKVLRLISLLIVAAILVNILPWLWSFL